MGEKDMEEIREVDREKMDKRREEGNERGRE